jgi:glycosyltransferase involved in cell wall biosynthesis
MDNSLVSVVIPTDNRGALITRAITSALGQSWQPVEVVVVDDASTDNTNQVVANIGDPRVKYLRLEKKGGACVARNAGIDAAKGEYVAFLDSDDEWHPEKIASQIETLKESDLPNVGIVTCGEIAVRPDGRTVSWTPSIRGSIFNDLLMQRQIGCRTSCLLVKSSILRDHRIRFDPALPARQDWDFVAQVAQVAQLDYVTAALVTVHHHGGDRVWTPARAVTAGLFLHDKYESFLDTRPSAHNRFHLRIALSCMSGGDWDEARRQVRAAFSAHPYRPVNLLWLLLTARKQSGRPSLLHRIGIRIANPLTF